jgi:hypothetical protein
MAKGYGNNITIRDRPNWEEFHKAGLLRKHEKGLPKQPFFMIVKRSS